jgi:hypothetical protein
VPAATVLTRDEGWLVNFIDINAVGVPGRGCGAPDDSAQAAPAAPNPG